MNKGEHQLQFKLRVYQKMQKLSRTIKDLEGVGSDQPGARF
jgi:hypothetical protein